MNGKAKMLANIQTFVLLIDKIISIKALFQKITLFLLQSLLLPSVQTVAFYPTLRIFAHNNSINRNGAYNSCPILSHTLLFFLLGTKTGKFLPREQFCKITPAQNITQRKRKRAFKFSKLCLLPKGQLISKCPFEKIVSTKIPTKKFDRFCPKKLYRQGKYLF